MPVKHLGSALALVTLATLLVATSQAPSPAPGPPTPVQAVAHCDAVAAMGTCVEYASKEAADQDCNSYSGSVADGACPGEEAVGRCILGDGKVRRYYRGENGYEPGFAEKHCQNAMAGTWSR